MTKPTKLTPAQRNVLEAAARGDLYQSGHHKTLYAVFVRGERKRFNRVADPMIGALLMVEDCQGLDRPITITDAGRALLDGTPSP